MKLCVAVVIFVIVPSMTYAQWQVVKEPQLWMVQEPPRANVAEPQGDTPGKQKSSDEPSPSVRTEPQPPDGQSGSTQAGQDEKNYWWWNAIRQRLDDPDWRLFAIILSQTIIIGFQLVQSVYGARAANAAKESARVARIALEVAERADLLVEQCSFEGECDVNPLKITLPMTNTGRTRATIVASVVQGFVGDRPPAPLIDDKLLQRTLEGFVIPSQRTCNHHLTMNSIVPENLQAVREGKKSLYVHGRVLYRDGFRGASCDLYETFFLQCYDMKRKQFLILNRNTSAEDEYT